MRPARLGGNWIENVDGSERVKMPARRAKVGPGHANHGVALPGQRDGAPEDAAIPAELPLPERVAQDKNTGPAEAIVFRRNRAAQHRACAEHAEEVTAHQAEIELHRLASARIIRGLQGDATDALKRLALRRDIFQ